jgi:hypothetical protein
LAWYLEFPPKSPAGSLKTRRWGKEGEDGVTLSKIQLFDNWRASLGEEKTNLTKQEKCGGCNHVSVHGRTIPARQTGLGKFTLY